MQIAVELFLVDGSIDGEEIDYALAGTYDKIEEWDQLVRTITDASNCDIPMAFQYLTINRCGDCYLGYP